MLISVTAICHGDRILYETQFKNLCTIFMKTTYFHTGKICGSHDQMGLTSGTQGKVNTQASINIITILAK